MLIPTLLSLLEKLLSVAVQHQQAAHVQWEQLYHKPILLRLNNPQLSCYLVLQPDTVIFREAQADDCVTVSLETDLTTALQVLRGRQVQGSVVIQGQAHIATLLARYIRNYQPNIELLLANLVGEGCAYAICHQMQRTADVCQANIDHFHHSSGEYITHECQLTPSRLELEKFYRDVDQLANRTDWLAAHLARLEKPNAK